MSTEGTALLLTPIGLDPRCWEGLQKCPWENTLTYTYPGFGDRNAPGGEYRLEDLADELRDLVDAEASGPVHVVGASMGGMLAQQLAIRHPGTVASLVLACTGPDSDPVALRERAAALKSRPRADIVSDALERWFEPATLAEVPVPSAVAYTRAVLEGIDRRSFAIGWLALAGHDVTARLHEISVPVTCIAAENDMAAPVSRLRRIADSVQKSRLVMMPGAHMSFMEHPDLFGAELAAHAEWARHV